MSTKLKLALSILPDYDISWLFYLVRNMNNSDIWWHRDNNRPAYISYYRNFILKGEIFWYYDNRHRTDGPASIEYDETGQKIDEDFYWHGKKLLDREEFDAIVRSVQKKKKE